MLRFNEICGMKEKKRYQGFHFVACFGGVKLEFGFDFCFHYGYYGVCCDGFPFALEPFLWIKVFGSSVHFWA
jgi:hypothetical protein